MDDMLILHPDKNRLLKWQKQISTFLQDYLELKLHPKKQVIQAVSHGIDFLGYITKPTYILSRRRVVSSLKQKLHSFNQEYIDLNLAKKAQAVINSYYGHFKHANSYHLRKTLYYNHFKELKKCLIPADENFSYFIIPEKPSESEGIEGA